MAGRAARLIVPAGTAAALVLVVVLAVQNERLRAELADLRYRSIRPQAGEFVPAFVAPTMTGETVRIVSGDTATRQVLLVFTTTCRYCDASVAAWNNLARRVALEGGTVLGISLDSLEETRHYTGQHGLEYPVIRFPNETYRRMYRANSVPITMVIDGGGRVIYARMGVIESDAAKDSVVAAARAPQKPARGGEGIISDTVARRTYEEMGEANRRRGRHRHRHGGAGVRRARRVRDGPGQ
jgi:peroxiredoxin